MDTIYERVRSGGGASLPVPYESVGDVTLKVPIRSSGSDHATLCFYIEIPPPIVVGEVWDIYGELHLTNDEMRFDSVNWITEIRIGYDATNTRDGPAVATNGRTFRVGQEAHHGLQPRSGVYEWTEQQDVSRFIKFFSWGLHSSATSNTDFDVTANRGKLTLLRFS